MLEVNLYIGEFLNSYIEKRVNNIFPFHLQNMHLKCTTGFYPKLNKYPKNKCDHSVIIENANICRFSMVDANFIVHNDKYLLHPEL